MLVLVLAAGALAPMSLGLQDGGDAANGSAAGELKFLADFSQDTYEAGGKPLARDDIRITGAARVIPGEGLATYKGGVNEVVDPSFEGEGWELGSGAAIVRETASRGESSLRVSGESASGVFAALREPVPVAAAYRESTTKFVGAVRAVSFDCDCSGLQAGALRVRISALGEGGEVIGEAATQVTAATDGWQRIRDLVFDLPAGTASYSLEVAGEGFTGACSLDGFLVEQKDYYTPYFDGDDELGAWVTAATPQNFYVEPNSTGARMLVKGALLALFGATAAVVSVYVLARGIVRRRVAWIILGPVVGLPLLVFAAVSLGAVRIPGGWPLSLTFQGSSLEVDRTYFYRVSSVDAEGNESPASIEGRAKTDWVNRKAVLTWDEDPGAVRYRVYRGEASRGEDEYVEIDAGTGMFIDRGEEMDAGEPVVALEDTAAPHASRSLRPDTDVRVSNELVGLDTASDFWVAGELELGFPDYAAFRPCSLFEIGNPSEETNFAVSLRYVPTWGDDGPHILPIVKRKDQAEADFGRVRLPDLEEGAVIRYLAALTHEPAAGRPAGMHLWYRIDGGEVHYVHVEHEADLTDDVLIIISKRYYLDYFSNNSVAPAFAIVQGTVGQGDVDTVMGPGTVPQQLRQAGL